MCQCDKSFRQTSVLGQHQRIHTTARQYKCGKLFNQNLSSFILRSHWRKLTCAVNVCNFLAVDPSLFDNGQFTLEKGIMSALNVGNPLDENCTSLYTGEFTLEKGLMNAVSVENLLSIA